MIRRSIYLQPDENEALRRMAYEENLPVSEIIRDAIRKHLVELGRLEED